MSWPNLHQKISPGSIELTDSEISSFFGAISWKFWLAFLISISPAAVLLLELERLYESYNIHGWGLSTFPGAELPAGPPKFDLDLTFMYVMQKCWCHRPKLWSKNQAIKQLFLDLSYEPSDAPWSQIILNWATTRIDRTDFEKSQNNLLEVTRLLLFVGSLLLFDFPCKPYYS